jgi:hypothetical protein
MKIAGTTVPTPSQLKFSYEDIDKAERTEDGTMFIETIAPKRKLEIMWNYLSRADASSLLSLVITRIVSIEYDDMVTGATRTANFYTSTKAGEVTKYNTDGTAKGYSQITFNCIEQ